MTQRIYVDVQTGDWGDARDLRVYTLKDTTTEDDVKKLTHMIANATPEEREAFFQLIGAHGV